jgi:hypothetical protein
LAGEKSPVIGNLGRKRRESADAGMRKALPAFWEIAKYSTHRDKPATISITVWWRQTPTGPLPFVSSRAPPRSPERGTLIWSRSLWQIGNGVAVGDFNGDNKPDLIVPIGGGNNVGVLLGQGDGTFTPPPAGARQADAEAEQAIAWLKKAVAAGYKNAAHMQKDKDFDALRDREDFKKLLAELAAGAAKQK